MLLSTRFASAGVRTQIELSTPPLGTSDTVATVASYVGAALLLPPPAFNGGADGPALSVDCPCAGAGDMRKELFALIEAIAERLIRSCLAVIRYLDPVWYRVFSWSRLALDIVSDGEPYDRADKRRTCNDYARSPTYDIIA